MTAHVQLPGLLGPGSPPATLSRDAAHRPAPGRAGLRRPRPHRRAHRCGPSPTCTASRRRRSGRRGGGGRGPGAASRARGDGGFVAAARPEGRPTSGFEAPSGRILEMKARAGAPPESVRLAGPGRRRRGIGRAPRLRRPAATRSITLVRDDSSCAARPGRAVVHLRYAPSTWLWAGSGSRPGLRDGCPGAVEVLAGRAQRLGGVRAGPAATPGLPADGARDRDRLRLALGGLRTGGAARAP